MRRMCGGNVEQVWRKVEKVRWEEVRTSSAYMVHTASCAGQNKQTHDVACSYTREGMS